MTGPVVVGAPALSKILLVGQAPGDREPKLGRPCAWTAGKTLFKWFLEIGIDEPTFRERVYMAAVCRCFPGKKERGGDRVPSDTEIASCAGWLDREIALLQPELVLPVGRLAIEQFLPPQPLVELIGRRHEGTRAGVRFALIPLPHPSGASTWFRTEPGRTHLGEALDLISRHPTWRSLLRDQRDQVEERGSAKTKRSP